MKATLGDVAGTLGKLEHVFMYPLNADLAGVAVVNEAVVLMCEPELACI